MHKEQKEYPLLNKLFEVQLEKLESLGTPQVILEYFQNKKDKVIATAERFKSSEGRIPFLPVIPRGYLGIHVLMSMVKHKGKGGDTDLRWENFSDLVRTPEHPYYALDVEDGTAIRGKCPKDAEKFVKSKGRTCLTTEEVIALCIHTKVLSKPLRADATGSRYRQSYVPSLYIYSKEGGTSLSWIHPINCGFGDHWGSGSCGCRAYWNPLELDPRGETRFM